MRILPAILTTIASLIFADATLAQQKVDAIVIGGRVKKPGSYDRIENESLAALLNRIGGIPASQKELEQYRRGEPVFRVMINLYRDGMKKAFKIDPKSNELWELIILKHDVIEVGRAYQFEAPEYPATITLNKPAEQADTKQPSIPSDLKSEGSDTPQPDSEGRSR